MTANRLRTHLHRPRITAQIERLRRLRGFSLVELAVAVAIIGVLATIAIMTFAGQRENAQNAEAINALRITASVMAGAGGTDSGALPDDVEDLVAYLNEAEPSLTFVSGANADPEDVDWNWDGEDQKVVITYGSVYAGLLAESERCWVWRQADDRSDAWTSFEGNLERVSVEETMPCGGDDFDPHHPDLEWRAGPNGEPVDLSGELNVENPSGVPAASDDSYSDEVNTIISGDVSANDSGLEDTPVVYSVETGVSNGNLFFNGDGTFVYEPDSFWAGTDTFIYEVCDSDLECDTAEATITVTAVNAAPVAGDGSVSAQEDTATTVDLAALVSDADNSTAELSITITASPTSGSLSDNGDGTWDYTPNTGFTGADSFTFEVCDPESLCDTGTISVTVNPGNDPPAASDDTASTDEDTAVTVDVAANDTDPDANLDLTSVTVSVQASNGSATSNGDGTVDYTPGPNFNGSDSFTYQICDTEGACDSAVVTITVNPVNDPPTTPSASPTSWVYDGGTAVDQVSVTTTDADFGTGTHEGDGWMFRVCGDTAGSNCASSSSNLNRGSGSVFINIDDNGMGGASTADLNAVVFFQPSAELADAYAEWGSGLVCSSVNSLDPVYVSVSDDGGATWSAATTIDINCE